MKPQRPHTSPPAQITSIQRWINILNSQFPLISNWLRDSSIEKLENAYRAGERTAAVGLANAAVGHPDQSVRIRCLNILKGSATAQSIDGIWESWSINRSDALEGCLRHHNLPASSHPRLKTLSLIILEKATDLARSGPEAIAPLLEFGNTPEFQNASIQALSNLKKQTAIDALCVEWAKSRSPQIAEIIKSRYQPKHPVRVCVLTALKFNHFEDILNGGPEVVLPLLDSLLDVDPVIQKNAEYCLRNLQGQKAANELCRVWSEGRSLVIEKIILDADYHPSSPRKLKLLVALLESKARLVQMANPDDLDWLFVCCHDPNPVIAANANLALRQLSKTETRSHLCMLSIETEDPFIRQICREAKYLPDKGHERAKYLFFDEQWEEYSLNDINHAFMKGYYQVASTEERRKISRHIQVSGQTDLFDILTSRITIQNQTTTSFEEQQYLASILTSTKAWNSLWEMAQNTFPSIAAEIIKSISTQGWIPEGPNDQLIFYSLVEMAKRSMLFDLNTLEMILPAALPQADLQIHGTVNCTSFSLTDPVLAIGTNEKKIALWNYQLGKMENIVSGFNHSLSNLAYSNTGDLFVSEKSIGAQNCGIYLWKNHELALIGLHNASITAIVPYGDHLLLSGGRDFTINQWDSGHNRKIATIQCPDWPRSLSFHETRQQAIGLDSKITLINWAEKKISRRYQISTNTSRGIRRSINQCALISPNDDRIFIGQHNGQVIAIDGLLARHRVVTSLITNFSGRVIGINQLPFKPYCIAGSASGELGLIDQTNTPTVRMIPSPTAGLTSLTVSPDGNYMATGYRKNRQTLWDLEVLKIPALLNQPIAFDHANTLNMINKFSGDLRLTEEVRNSLQFLKLLLQHRYRYDIDIVQTTGIVPGLFDIILDNQ